MQKHLYENTMKERRCHKDQHSDLRFHLYHLLRGVLNGLIFIRSHPFFYFKVRLMSQNWLRAFRSRSLSSCIHRGLLLSVTTQVVPDREQAFFSSTLHVCQECTKHNHCRHRLGMNDNRTQDKFVEVKSFSTTIVVSTRSDFTI